MILAGHGASSVQRSPPPELKLTFSPFVSCRLYPLSEKENMCKALLPIGNEPMISYVLNWLEQAGIIGENEATKLTSSLSFLRLKLTSSVASLPSADVLILTPASYYSSLSHHLQSFRSSQSQNGDGAMKINLQAVKGSASEGGEDDSDEDEDEVLKGKTADLLREYRDSLFVRPANSTLCSRRKEASSSQPSPSLPSPPDRLHRPPLRFHSPTKPPPLDRPRFASNTAERHPHLALLRARRRRKGRSVQLALPAPNAKLTLSSFPFAGPDRILVGLDKTTGTLLHVQDIEDMEDDIPIRMSMMWK